MQCFLSTCTLLRRAKTCVHFKTCVQKSTYKVESHQHPEGRWNDTGRTRTNPLPSLFPSLFSQVMQIRHRRLIVMFVAHGKQFRNSPNSHYITYVLEPVFLKPDACINKDLFPFNAAMLANTFWLAKNEGAKKCLPSCHVQSRSKNGMQVSDISH